MSKRQTTVRYSFQVEVDQGGYSLILKPDTVLLVPLEKPYFQQYHVDLFMTGLELLGLVFLPSIQHVKTYLEFDGPKGETVRPLTDLIGRSQLWFFVTYFYINQ